MKSALVICVLLGIVAAGSSSEAVSYGQKERADFSLATVEELMKSSNLMKASSSNAAECNDYVDEQGYDHTHCVDTITFGDYWITLESDDAEGTDGIYVYHFGWST
mmetsp:Transcript_7120/g.6222  ORF Transcript_7120/g.6222 Transcript_7120/m.6222 type:complete len:106 (+) Transcript_7120:51-368(+)